MSPLTLSRRDGRAVAALLLTFCLAHIHELTNFNISIDDEFIGVSPPFLALTTGRWLHTALAFLWPQSVMPAAPLLLFGIFLSISFIYMARLLGMRRLGVGHIVIFAAFALHPIWMAQLAFAGNVLPVGIGVLAATAAAQLLAPDPSTRLWQRRGRIAASTALVTVAVGAYQSLNLFFLVLAFAGALAHVAHGTAGWRTCIRSMVLALLVCAAASVLSTAIAWLLLKSWGIPFSYVVARFQPAELRVPLWQEWRLALRDAARSYGSYWEQFAHARMIFNTTILLSVAFSIWATPPKKRLGALALMLVLIFIPGSIVLIAGTPQPPRVYMAATAVLACFLLLAYATAGQRTWLKRAVVVLAALTATQGLYINAIHQARAWVVQQRDQHLAHDIYTAITRLRSGRLNGADAQHIFLDFHGALPVDKAYEHIWPREKSETMGVSFFEWDGGNPWRIVAYMNLLGYTDIKRFTEINPNEFAALYQTMPAWPADGAIRKHRYGYLIKLSNP